jgi:hypothetical protein
MAWRIAESLKQLRAQINEAYPNRDKSSDGGIGDALHASRNSDHNPWVKDKHGVGVVTAIDIDEDLAGNIHSVEAIVSAIRASKDPRVKYIIYEKRITVAGSNLQKWKAYTGKNPHDKHAHISVNSDPKLYDSVKPWALGLKSPSKVSATPAKSANTSQSQVKGELKNEVAENLPTVRIPTAAGEFIDQLLAETPIGYQTPEAYTVGKPADSSASLAPSSDGEGSTQTAPPSVEVKAAETTWTERIAASVPVLAGIGASIKDGLKDPYVLILIAVCVIVAYLIWTRAQKAKDARTKMYFENAQNADTPAIKVV